MQTAYQFFDISAKVKKLSSNPGFRFTERELDILEFVLEMKFATLESIHFKFFRDTKNGTKSSSTIWARQRLALLLKSGFLKLETQVCNRSLYVLTLKGYQFLRNSRSFQILSKPLFDIDARFYDHDRRVTELRLSFEKQGLVNEWISERKLSEIEEVKKYLPNEFRPDALYVNRKGERVAFELEIARKSKERYQSKVKRYLAVMTEADPSLRIFDRVHYVFEKPKILDFIQSEVSLYSSLFTLSLESEFIKPALVEG